MARNGAGVMLPVNNSWSPPVNGTLATGPDFKALYDDLLAALTQSVSRDGQSAMTGDLQMGGFKLTGMGAGVDVGQSLAWQQLFSQGVEADIASAATTDIGLQNTNFLRVTGNTTISSFGTNYRGPRFLRFAGAVTLTNSSTLVLPGAANITTAAGATLIAVPGATGGVADKWVVVGYQNGALTNLANGVTGTLPVANGGTGATNFTAGALLKGAGTGAVTVASAADIVGQIGATAVTNATNATNATTATKLSTDSGSAPSYSARAWVNFNGTGTVAINASGNVSSITDNGVGLYTINFTNSLGDQHYSAVFSVGFAYIGGVAASSRAVGITSQSATACSIVTWDGTSAGTDLSLINASFFR